MNSIQTEPEELTAVAFDPIQQEEITESQPRSFTAFLKRIVHRFVAWIDNVDRDGQEFWN